MESIGLRNAARWLRTVTAMEVRSKIRRRAARNIQTGIGLRYGKEDTQRRIMTMDIGAVTMKQVTVMLR